MGTTQTPDIPRVEPAPPLTLRVPQVRAVAVGLFGVSTASLAYAAHLAPAAHVVRSFLAPVLLGCVAGVMVLAALDTLRLPPERRPMLTQLIPGALGPVLACVYYTRPFIPWLAPATYFALIGAGAFMGGLFALRRLLVGGATP
jgi:hypothetical protein